MKQCKHHNNYTLRIAVFCHAYVVEEKQPLTYKQVILLTISYSDNVYMWSGIGTLLDTHVMLSSLIARTVGLFRTRYVIGPVFKNAQQVY